MRAATLPGGPHGSLPSRPLPAYAHSAGARSTVRSFCPYPAITGNKPKPALFGNNRPAPLRLRRDFEESLEEFVALEAGGQVGGGMVLPNGRPPGGNSRRSVLSGIHLAVVASILSLGLLPLSLSATHFRHPILPPSSATYFCHSFLPPTIASD